MPRYLSWKIKMKTYFFIATLIFTTIVFVFTPFKTLANEDADTGSFGIGTHGTFPLSGISAKYWSPTGTGIQGFIASAIYPFPEDLTISFTRYGGRILYAVHKKPRTKLYIGAGVNYALTTIFDIFSDANVESFGLEGLCGVEYAFSELPNIRFSFEFGVNILRFGAKDTNFKHFEYEYSDDYGYDDYGYLYKRDLHFSTSGIVGIHYYF